jgi:hypothetical protein
MDVEAGWGALMRRAAAHHGIVTFEDLVAHGMTRHQVVAWTHAGRLVPMGRGSYLVAGAPLTFEARALGLIAVHGPQTWAAQRTAAALWRIPGHPEDHRIELLRPADGSNERRGAIVHRSSLIPPEHVTVTRGVPVTTPERTIMDLAGTLGPLRLERTVAEAVRRGLCTDAGLHVVLARMAGRGRPGTRQLRKVLAAREGAVPGQSELEALCRALILAAGLPEPEWEVDLSDERGWIGRVDGLMRPWRIVIELDSYRWHGQATDARHDAARDRRLAAAGYLVLRRTWFDLTQRPEVFIAELSALLEARDPAA